MSTKTVLLICGVYFIKTMLVINAIPWSSRGNLRYWWDTVNPWRNITSANDRSDVPTVSPDGWDYFDETCRCMNETECVKSNGWEPINYGGRVVTYKSEYFDEDVDCIGLRCCHSIKNSTEDDYPADGTNVGWNKCGISTSSIFIKNRIWTDIDRTNAANERLESDPGQFPWTLAVFKDMEYLCVASLLSATFAITTGSCVYIHAMPRYKNYLELVAGVHNISNNEEAAHQVRSVTNISIHDRFQRNPLMWDFALLRVDKPFQQSIYVNSICLPDLKDNFVGSECYASGWSVHSRGADQNRLLKKAELSILPWDECKRIFKTSETAYGRRRIPFRISFLCAVNDKYGDDTCEGDGGAPLACSNSYVDQVYYLAGITSYSVAECTTGVPGAYANVTKAIPWIKETMAHTNDTIFLQSMEN